MAAYSRSREVQVAETATSVLGLVLVLGALDVVRAAAGLEVPASWHAQVQDQTHTGRAIRFIVKRILSVGSLCSVRQTHDEIHHHDQDALHHEPHRSTIACESCTRARCGDTAHANLARAQDA